MNNNISKSLANFDPRIQWKWKLPRAKIVNNHDFYCNLAQRKTILHIGCTDHKEIIDIKMKNHQYLHVKLMEHAKLVHGIDINKEAITYLKDKYRIANIYYYDITRQGVPSDLLKSYDLIFIPEVIEHVLHLSTFLKSVKKFMTPTSLLVIGTPNSLRFHNFFTVFKGYEEVNPDHKYCFSYATLKSLLEYTGFTVNEWYTYIYGKPNRRLFKYGVRSLQSLIKSLFIEINPWFGDGIIVQARLERP